MTDRDDGEWGRSGPSRDTIALALVGLVTVLSMVIATTIALPAWASLNAVATATATPPAATVPAAGLVATSPPATPNQPTTVATARPRATATIVPDAGGVGETPTPTLGADATVRPAPPSVPDDGSGESYVVQSGPEDRREIALTFDAGDDRGHAEDILDLLDERGLVASFGVTGEWAEANPDLIRRMVADGHMLINHTYSHQSFTGESTGTGDPGTDFRMDELRRTQSTVEDIAGYDLRPYFRPPYGDLGPQMLLDVANAGYGITVMWSVDSLGWQEGATADAVVTRVLDGATPGGILLFHVSDTAADFDALPAILDGLAEQGYTPVTVEQLLQP